MFVFSGCETLFMLSMAMSYFYSWQVYSDPDANGVSENDEVMACDLKEVIDSSIESFKSGFNRCCQSPLLLSVMTSVQPLTDRLEKFTGRGGNLRATGFSKKYDRLDGDEEASLNHFEVESPQKDVRQRQQLQDLINESDSSDEDNSN